MVRTVTFPLDLAAVQKTVDSTCVIVQNFNER